MGEFHASRFLGDESIAAALCCFVLKEGRYRCSVSLQLSHSQLYFKTYQSTLHVNHSSTYLRDTARASSTTLQLSHTLTALDNISEHSADIPHFKLSSRYYTSALNHPNIRQEHLLDDNMATMTIAAPTQSTPQRSIGNNHYRLAHWLAREADVDHSWTLAELWHPLMQEDLP